MPLSWLLWRHRFLYLGPEVAHIKNLLFSYPINEHNTNLIEKTSAVIILLVNSLFVLKYAWRAIGPSAILLMALVAFVQVAPLVWRPASTALTKLATPIAIATTVALFGGVALLAHVYILVDSLNVDRWSVIGSFLEALKAGDYPYSAESHMGNPPGPMPVYYLIAKPFYELGLLEVLSALGPIVSGWFLALRSKKSRPAKLAWWLLVTSPALYWEIVVRSNIFTTSLMVFVGLYGLIKSYTSGKYRQAILAAACCGLLLSTRSVFGLAYIIVYGALALAPPRANFLRVAGRGAITLLVFLLTFAPFILHWGWDTFYRANPFITQSSFLMPRPLVVAMLCLACLSLLLVWVRRNSLLASGIMLFVVVGVYAIYHLGTSGLERAYFGSVIDISYFIFCMPFMLWAVFSSSAPRRAFKGSVYA